MLDPEDVVRMNRQELLEKAERGEITILDVRPADEYRAEHIRGARSVPLDERESAIATLPADQVSTGI